MTTWGNWVTNGLGRGFRLGYDFQTVAETDTSKTVRLIVSFTCNYGVNDGTNSFPISGDWSRSGSVSVICANGQVITLYTGDIVVTKQYGTTLTRSFSASLNGLEVYGTSLTGSVSGSTTIAARPYTTPAAPTAATVTRVSDTQQTIAWTRNPSTGAPYDNILVQRRIGGGAWSTVATLAGTATSWSDTTTVKDGRYDYQVAAKNSVGTSAYARTSPDVSTTPNDPTTVVGVKNGDGSITLTWADDDAGYPTNWKSRFDIERSVNGGAYANVANDLAEGTRTWTDVSPGVGTNTYRIQAWVPNTGQTESTLSSGWATSNTVQTTAPPNAPSGLGPTTTRPGTEPTTLVWTHNPTDSSVQRKSQLQYREQGTGTWYQGAIATSADASKTLTPITDINGLGAALADGDTVEWQVRTWGAATTGGADGTGASAWSATSTFLLKSRPTAALSSPTPAQVLTTSTVTVTWSYFQAQSSAQSSWSARLYKSGVLVATKTGSGTGTTTSFTGLSNSSSYSVQVDVTSSDGLVSAVDSESFTTDFLPPVVVNVQATYFPESASIALGLLPDQVEGGVTVAASSVTIERSVNDGPWHVIADGVAPDAAVIDTQPTINGVNRYRLTVYSASPSARVEDRVLVASTPSFDPDNPPAGRTLVPQEGSCTFEAYQFIVDNGGGSYSLYEDGFVQVATCEENTSFLTTGPSFDQMAAILCEARISVSTSRNKTVQAFAGRDWPLEMSTDNLSQSVTVSTSVAGERNSVGSIEALEALALTNSIVLWRDPTGRRMFGSLGSVSAGQAGLFVPQAWNPGFTVRRVDHDG